MTHWDNIFLSRQWGWWPSEPLVRFMSKFSGGKVLELGSGPGANIWFLAMSGFYATGIDTSSVAIEQCHAKVKKFGLEKSVALYLADMTNLPFDDDQFDFIVDVESILCVPDPSDAYVEAYRVLKPGGKMFSLLMSDETDAVDALNDKGRLSYTKYTDIPAIVYPFIIDDIGSVSRTSRGQTVKEWVIEVSKP